MNRYQVVSRHCVLALKIFLMFFAILMIYRIVFVSYYGLIQNLSFSKVLSIFGFLARSDARWAATLAFFFLVISAFRFASPFYNRSIRYSWIVIYSVIACFVILACFIDFGDYAYRETHSNISILNVTSNGSEAWGIIWKSYHVVYITLGFVLIAAFAVLRLCRIFKVPVSYKGIATDKRVRVISFIVTFLFFCICMFWKLGQYPLRWSLAYAGHSNFMGNAALNPFETTFNTLKYRGEKPYDLNIVKESHQEICNLLRIEPNSNDSLSLLRTVPMDSSRESRTMNVVLIIAESFAAHMSSTFGNGLPTSPYFDKLSKQGVLFDHCFAARRGTAFGVFSLMTGIPDFESPSTASRNPTLADQRILFNQLQDYNHLYFIGGSLSWANVRAVLAHNMDHLKTYEELDFKAPRTDVWGVSDYALLMESNEILTKQDKPFTAVIQLADNHPPYSISKAVEAAGFKNMDEDDDTLKKWGFRCLKEFNAYRCFDFTLNAYFEKARTEKYFDNTLFVIIGDHGLDTHHAAQMPEHWCETGLTNVHTPLFFYAPKYLTPKRISTVVSQIDVLPSIMAFLNKPYIYNGFGQNVFDPVVQNDSLAVRFSREEGFGIEGIGAYTQHVYVRTPIKDKSQTVLYDFNEPKLSPEKADSLKNYLRDISTKFYNTDRYIIRHNQN